MIGVLLFTSFLAGLAQTQTAQAPWPTDLPCTDDYCYDDCYAAPLAITQGLVITEVNLGRTAIQQDSLISLAADQSSHQNALSFRFISSNGRAAVYDLVTDTADGRRYLTLYDDGAVDLGTVSSGGNAWQPTADGTRQFLTTAWTLQCSGELLAGQPDTSAFEFYLQDGVLVSKWAVADPPPDAVLELFAYNLANGPLLEAQSQGDGQAVARSLQFDLISGRQDDGDDGDDGDNGDDGDDGDDGDGGDPPPWPMYPPGVKCNCDYNPRCPYGYRGTVVHEKDDARPPASNGCGQNVPGRLADFNFGECCDGHDFCYDTCDATFDDCNKTFKNCMVRKCEEDWPDAGENEAAGIALFQCLIRASVYNGLVESRFGSKASRDAFDERCECPCTSDRLCFKLWCTDGCDTTVHGDG